VDSQLFPSARQLFLTGQLNWLTGDMRAILLVDSFVPTFAEENLDDISSTYIVATSELITGRTAVDGVASSDVIELGLLLSSLLCSKAIIYKDTGVAATSSLILFIGDDGLVSAPFVPVGLEYFIYPNVVAGGLFSL
jgi:hypothetical protein